jgi:ribonuclease J
MPHRKKDLHRPPEDALWLLPLGGSGEIGMNLNLYGTSGKWLMVDCGVMFPDETMPGIEIITPDITFIAERRDDLVGVVITHGHEDHLGALERPWPICVAHLCVAFLRRSFAPIRRKPDAGQARLSRFLSAVLLGGPFAVEMVRVTHSIPESHMIAIKTAHGTVLHTAIGI